MLCVWVHGCDPGRVSDGSRLALPYTKLVLSSALLLSFSGMCFVLLCSFLFDVFIWFCFHSRWSFLDVPLIFSCPAHHVPDWQPPTLLGMVEAP